MEGTRRISYCGVFLAGLFLFFLVGTARSGSLSVATCPGVGPQVLRYNTTSNEGWVSAYGSDQTTCYANVIKGVTSVSGFSYVLSIYSGGNTPPPATATILDVESLAVLNTVSINLPVGGSTTILQATFPNSTTLVATKSYYLAFCCDWRTGSVSYSFARDQSNSNPRAFYYCNDNNCAQAGADWTQSGYSITLISNITYVCNTTLPSPSPSALGTASPSPSPSPSSVSPSPSPSPAVALVSPITANVTANFDGSLPNVDMSAPRGSSNGSSPVSVAVRSSLSQIQLGTSGALSGLQWSVTTANPSSAGTTYTYSTALDNTTTSLAHSVTYLQQPSQGNFSGLTFDIEAASVKWTISISSTTTNRVGSNGITLSYLVSDLSASDASASSVLKVRNSPAVNMTTYYLPVSSSSSGQVMAVVQVFDVALIDDSFLYINHSIAINSDAEYVLVLDFPPFAQSLVYDPSLGLGVLLGSAKDGSGSDNTAMIVAVAVVVPVALLVVVGAAVAGTVILYMRRRRQLSGIQHQLAAMN